MSIKRIGADATTTELLEDIFDNVEKESSALARTLKFDIELDKELLDKLRKIRQRRKAGFETVETDKYTEGTGFNYWEVTMTELVFDTFIGEVLKSGELSSDDIRRLYGIAVRHHNFDAIKKSAIRKIEKEEELLLSNSNEVI